MDMRKKRSVPFTEKFPNAADPSALKLLQRLLAFDPKDRPSAEEVRAVCSHKYPIYLHLNDPMFFSFDSNDVQTIMFSCIDYD